MGKWRWAVALMVLMVSGCGGGGGSSAPVVAVAMTPARNPVLVSYTSNTIRTVFPLPSAVPDGTQVHFTALPAVSVIPATATVSGGVTTVRVKSSAPGKYQVTATGTVGSTVYTGNVSVTFITQPSRVTLSVALNPPVAGLGALQLSVLNDTGIGAFQNISYNQGMYAFTNLSTGLVPSNNRTNVGAISAVGVNVTSTDPLLQLTYGITANGGLPGFAVDPASVMAYHADLGASAITPAPDVLLNWKYDTDIY